MNSTLSKVITFAAGAIIGSAVTWKLVKTKYEQIANEEIAEMREYLRTKQESEERIEPDKSIVNIEFDKNGFGEYLEHAMKYAGESNYEEKGGAEDMNKSQPYVITPEDFGEEDDYDIVSLTYYADGVVEDDQCNIMENPEEVLGEGFGDHFGEYDDYSVYVRNDELKIDYEILLDIRTYADANSVGSYKDDDDE